MRVLSKKYVRTTLGAVSVLFFLVLTSCGGRPGDGAQIPLSGELMYEVDYSENLREQSTIGAFLPHSAIGVYDSANFKISTSAPLSFAKVSLVHGLSGDFMSISFNDMKILTDFSSLTEESDTSSCKVTVKKYDSKHKICGYNSCQTSVSFLDLNGGEFRVDIFTAVDDNSGCGTLPPSGLVTAFSVRFDESNVIFLLKSVRPLEAVSPEEFERPQGFIETSAKDFVALLELM